MLRKKAVIAWFASSTELVGCSITAAKPASSVVEVAMLATKRRASAVGSVLGGSCMKNGLASALATQPTDDW
ncbi:hypothetical protein D3C87_2076140 [compost metagenome]